jgi:hypothetical protein
MAVAILYRKYSRMGGGIRVARAGPERGGLYDFAAVFRNTLQQIARIGRITPLDGRPMVGADQEASPSACQSLTRSTKPQRRYVTSIH